MLPPGHDHRIPPLVMLSNHNFEPLMKGVGGQSERHQGADNPLSSGTYLHILGSYPPFASASTT